MDKKILEQINEKLKSLGFASHFYLREKQGYIANFGKYNHNSYSVVLQKKSDITYLTKKLLPLSHHKEKIWKMELIVQNKDKNWNEIKNKLNKLKEMIKKEII